MGGEYFKGRRVVGSSVRKCLESGSAFIVRIFVHVCQAFSDMQGSLCEPEEGDVFETRLGNKGSLAYSLHPGP